MGTTQALHRNSNAVFRLVYHLVLVTKYRKKVFTGPMLDHAMVFTKDTSFLTFGRNSRAQEVYEADVVRIPHLPPQD